MLYERRIITAVGVRIFCLSLSYNLGLLTDSTAATEDSIFDEDLRHE